jgi:hypothetical protein
MEYDPRNWYWYVGGDETRAFSSAAGDYLPVTSSAFQSWKATGGLPTRIASEQELGEVLAPHAVRPMNTTVLDAYKDSQAAKLTIEIAAKVLFNHENRLRALEGKAPANAAQFKTALKALM